MTKSVVVGVRLDEQLKAKLEAIADADRRPLAQLIKLVLEDYVASKEGKSA